MAVVHSAKYEELKEKYSKKYITKDTLKKWVQVNEKKPGNGITREEYREITGEDY